MDFKHIVEQSVKQRDVIHADSSEIGRIFKKMYKEYSEKVGQTYLWKPAKNQDLKQKQLVEIVQVYPRFILVRKVVMNVDQHTAQVQYAISFNSLYCGQDRLESLEMI